MENIRFRDSGDGHPLVLIHGFPFDSSMWDEVTPALAANARCIAPDIRGLGASPSLAGPATIDDYADDLFSLMDRLKLEKPVLAGLSMGGYIALRALERDQDRFAGAILMDTRSSPDTDTARINRFRGIKTIRSGGIADFVEGFIPPTLHRENRRTRPELIQSLIRKAEGFSPVGLMNALLAMAARTDTTPFLPSLRIPTLLIVGEGDELTTPAIMEGMRNEIPGASLHIIPGAGHLPPLENPNATADIILGFLKGAVKA